MTAVLEEARRQTQAGRHVVPIPGGRKGPNQEGWQNLRLKLEELPLHFNNGKNLGLLTGEPSDGLVDVDLDAEEAVRLADEFLPSTGMEHGRPGMRRSHRWFLSPAITKTDKFRDPTKPSKDRRSMIVELRSTGVQTVIPPSRHPSGESYWWERNGEPARVGGEELVGKVKRLAACALLARHWPAEGSRDDLAMHLAGGLLRAGWSQEEVDRFVTLAAQAAGDEEWASRGKARQTAEKQAADDPTTGWPKAREILDPRIVNTVIKWLGITHTSEPAAGPTGPYEATDRGLVWRRPTSNGGTIRVPLTNFTARIIADVARDDGAETLREFELEVKRAGRTYRFRVPAAQFAGMNWVPEHLGASAIVYPGQGTREHTRAAVQVLSGDVTERRVYAHTGWREVEGRPVYLHADGAIGVDGPVSGVEVELPDSLSPYSLPKPPDAEELRRAIRASLGMLKTAPLSISYPLLVATYRAPLGGADFSVHMTGLTGTGKTELAALGQRHYGAGMDARHLPGSWSSTGNALEGLGFQAADALLVIDDFIPSGSSSDMQRQHRDADRVLRGQGNHSGRLRMRPDSTLRPSKPPRGLVLSTGEDVPRGHSLRARMLVLELGPKDVDWESLTRCQEDAAAGRYAQSMAGYIRWLAGRDRRELLRRALFAYRQAATRSGMHRRTPEIVANLAAGLDLLLTYAESAGAVAPDEAGRLWQEGWKALGQAAGSQEQHQAASDPARRFIELLFSAISSGEAHVAWHNGGAPELHEAWGWRELDEGDLRPQGRRVGWLDGDNLYLEPDTSLAVAQSVGRQVGDSIAVTPLTLKKRLDEKGLLLTEERGGQRRLEVRRQIEGKRRYVLHLNVSTLENVAQVAQSDTNPKQDAEFGWATPPERVAQS